MVITTVGFNYIWGIQAFVREIVLLKNDDVTIYIIIRPLLN